VDLVISVLNDEPELVQRHRGLRAQRYLLQLELNAAVDLFERLGLIENLAEGDTPSGSTTPTALQASAPRSSSPTTQHSFLPIRERLDRPSHVVSLLKRTAEDLSVHYAAYNKALEDYQRRGRADLDDGREPPLQPPPSGSAGGGGGSASHARIVPGGGRSDAGRSGSADVEVKELPPGTQRSHSPASASARIVLPSLGSSAWSTWWRDGSRTADPLEAFGVLSTVSFSNPPSSSDSESSRASSTPRYEALAEVEAEANVTRSRGASTGDLDGQVKPPLSPSSASWSTPSFLHRQAAVEFRGTPNA
jgi:hypothetical protein